MLRKIEFGWRAVFSRSTGLLIVLAGMALGWQLPLPAVAEESPPADWIEWQHQRHESIAGPNGWTTLISLHWLPEGKTSVGSDPTNQFVLPADRVTGFVGVFSRTGDSVQFEAAPGVTAHSGGAPVHVLEMKSDASDKPSKLMVGSLSFVIIKRGERFGVRVRDPESPARHHFAGLHYFPYRFLLAPSGTIRSIPVSAFIARSGCDRRHPGTVFARLSGVFA